MDPWLPIIMILFVIAAWQNLRRMHRGNKRNGLRLAGLVVSLYIALIYLMAVIGAIPDVDIRLYMRWFQIPLGIYLVIEALNG